MSRDRPTGRSAPQDPHPRRRGYDSSWRAAQAAATVCRIREAAADLFALRGFADTTVADVAVQAGVSAESVYRRIGSKHDLLVDTLTYAFLGEAACTRLLDDPELLDLLEAGSLLELLDAVARCACDVSARLGPLWTAARAVVADDVERVLHRFLAQRRGDLVPLAHRIDGSHAEEVLGRLIVATSFETYAQLVGTLGLDEEQRVTWVQEQLHRIAGLEP